MPIVLYLRDVNKLFTLVALARINRHREEKEEEEDIRELNFY